MASAVPAPIQNGTHCAGLYIRDASIEEIGSKQTIVAISYNATTSSAQDEPILDVFTRCCAPGPVNQVDGDCLLWCEMPEEYLSQDEDRPGRAFDDSCFRPGWREDVPDWVGAIGVWGPEEEGDGGVVVRPRVMGVLLLVMLVVLHHL